MPPVFSGIASGYGSLVKSMPYGSMGHYGRTADTRYIFQLVHHTRIGYIGLTIGQIECQLVGDDAPQVTDMLPHGVIHVPTHLFIDFINAAAQRLGQTATSNDGIKLERYVELLQFVHNNISPKFALVADTLKSGQLLHTVTDIA